MELIDGHVCHWNSIYKNSFLRENKIDFIHNRYALGDISFMHQVYGNAKSVFIIKNSYYHYLHHSTGQNKRYNYDYDKAALELWLDCFNYAQKKLENSQNMTSEKWYILTHQEYKLFNLSFGGVKNDSRTKVLLEFSKLFKNNLDSGHVKSSYFSKEDWEKYQTIANDQSRKNPNIQIFIAYHKPAFTITSDALIPIQVGKALSNIDLGFIGDDTGDNISAKNPFYSELTATYWIWKNVKADVVGLYHYRRYFNLKDNNSHIDIRDKNFADLTGNNSETISALMKEYDIILTKSFGLKGGTNYDSLGAYYNKEELDIVLDVIKKKYPEQYDTAYKTFYHQNTGYSKNMLIAKKEVFDDYAKWLFSILFEVEKILQSDMEKRNDRKKRGYGFLSESLMPVYINLHPELKIKEVKLLQYVH